MNWTKKDIEKLKLKHNLTEKKGKSVKIVKISFEKEYIKKTLWWFEREKLISGYTSEHKFDTVRKFRFDWAIIDLKIAIEYEGIFSKKSGHTTVSGYTSDCSKYNLATVQGWKILRYTAKNYKQIAPDLKLLLIK